MNELQQALTKVALDRLRPVGKELEEAGWRPQLVIFPPEELTRIPGYKVALVVPLDSVTEVEPA